MRRSLVSSLSSCKKRLSTSVLVSCKFEVCYGCTALLQGQTHIDTYATHAGAKFPQIYRLHDLFRVGSFSFQFEYSEFHNCCIIELISLEFLFKALVKLPWTNSSLNIMQCQIIRCVQKRRKKTVRTWHRCFQIFWLIRLRLNELWWELIRSHIISTNKNHKAVICPALTGATALTGGLMKMSLNQSNCTHTVLGRGPIRYINWKPLYG